MKKIVKNNIEYILIVAIFLMIAFILNILVNEYARLGDELSKTQEVVNEQQEILYELFGE